MKNNFPIYGGTYEALFGGMSMNIVAENFLVINNAIVSGAVGGVNIYYGNRVEINGSTVGNVSGGEIAYAYITTGTAPTDFSQAKGSVHDNYVFISGRAYNNEVNISGNINTWNVTARSVDGFEFINFNNPSIFGTGLIVSDNVKLYGGLEKTFINTSGYSNLGTGSVFNLIYANNGISLNNVTGLASSADLINGANIYLTTMSRGVSFDYALALSLSADGKSLAGFVGQNLGVKEQTATASKAQIANVVPVNTGTDALVRGFDDFLGSNIAEDGDESFSDKAQAAEEVREAHGFEIFGSMAYGKLRFGTCTHLRR